MSRILTHVKLAGISEGMKEGIKEGRMAERQAIARAMLLDGDSIKKIVRLTELTTHDVQLLQEDTDMGFAN
ncbi:MAG: hypothetical protein C7B45_15225 [Sulfobacillus acidophilus]|uniref:Transposase n=1 Tax=Sulfobacillus acidophilus TaxID=53633 RepID=A0A2T2WDP2_9FIRM|nr:MAG: hypothetical protein C7B45_15225 [Sulfobacillus acidophilus]